MLEQEEIGEEGHMLSVAIPLWHTWTAPDSSIRQEEAIRGRRVGKEAIKAAIVCS